MRSSSFLALALFAAAPRVASAAESAVLDPTASDALTTEVSSGLSWIKNQSSYEPLAPYVYVDVAPSYRVSRLLSLGGIVSYGQPVVGSGGLSIWRFSGEARVHAIRTRRFDAWAGGEIGFAVSSFIPAPCAVLGGNSGGIGSTACIDPANLGTRVEPLFGAALGIEAFPVPYFSIGLVGRGMLVAFGSATDSAMPAGLSPAIFAGLSLGLHVPLGG